MIYPKWLKPGDTIGITAPSAGAGLREGKLEKFQLSMDNLRRAGYKVKETASVRSGSEPSASGETRAAELKELAEDNQVSLILCAAGGDFLVEMLPYTDFETIRRHPKWIQGYSDPTSLLYSVTTGLDIATIYGTNGGGFGMTQLHPSLRENLSLWRGELTAQESYDLYEGEWADGEVDGYNLTTPVVWNTPNGNVDVTGRLIGGCMDCLLDLIGTPYDHTMDFIRRYSRDSFIWYFDVFSMTAESVYRTLLHMKSAGWFQGAAGFIFGRVAFPQTYVDMTYREAAVRALGKEIPVVLEADVGHVDPKMTFVNGCVAHLQAGEGKGRISYEWRE